MKASRPNSTLNPFSPADSSRHLPELDGISEQHDDSFSELDQGLDLEEDDLDRVISFLRSLGGGRYAQFSNYLLQ